MGHSPDALPALPTVLQGCKEAWFRVQWGQNQPVQQEWVFLFLIYHVVPRDTHVLTLKPVSWHFIRQKDFVDVIKNFEVRDVHTQLLLGSAGHLNSRLGKLLRTRAGPHCP